MDMEIEINFGSPLMAMMDEKMDPGDWREGPGKRKVIHGVDGFHEEYRFLANDYPHSMHYRGKEYPDAASVLQALGWDGEDRDILNDVLRVKFDDSDLQEKLLATGDARIFTRTRQRPMGGKKSS